MKRTLMAGSFVLAVALLVLGGSPAAAQKGAKKRAAAKKLNDVILILELQKTAHLLSKANRDYKGHRAEAVKHIHHAVKHLKEEAKVRGLKGAGNDYKGPEPQPVSDAQLKQAIVNLKSSLDRVKSLSASDRRTRAGEHIGNAMGGLRLALEVAPK